MSEEFSLPEKSAFSIQEISEHFSTDIETVHDWLKEGLLYGCVRHIVGARPHVHGQHLPKLVVTKNSPFEQIDVEYEDGKLWRLSSGVVTQLIVEGCLDRSRINASLDSSQVERKHHFNGFRFEPPTVAAHECETYRVYMYNAPTISLENVLVSRIERDRFAINCTNPVAISSARGTRFKDQEHAILSWLRSENYDPRKLPADVPFKRGVKSFVRRAMAEKYSEFFPVDSSKVFDNAWERLCDTGEVCRLPKT